MKPFRILSLLLVLCLMTGCAYFPKTETEKKVYAYAKENGLSYREYPQSLIRLLERNPETEKFVLEYPVAKDAIPVIDLEDQLHTEVWRSDWQEVIRLLALAGGVVSRRAANECAVLAVQRASAEEAAAILDKAAADIAQEKKKAINDAKDEISDLALAIAGKVVGKTLSGADQTKLVDEFIDGLGDAT